MPLATADKIEQYLSLPPADAARVAGWVRPAERYLRALKGGLWYDAMLAAPSEVVPPGDGPDAASPVVTLTSPAPGETVESPILIRGTATDDVAVTSLIYKWYELGGDEAESGPRELPATLPTKSLSFSYLLGVPEGDAVLRVEAHDAAGNVGAVAHAVTVEGQELNVEPFAFAQGFASVEDRRAAEHAECLLCLYYGLPQLNLRLDPDGGVLTTVWESDEVTGARTQTQFAGSERLDALRADLLDQAKLLVAGGVRIDERVGPTSTLIDGVESYAGGLGGYLGSI